MRRNIDPAAVSSRYARPGGHYWHADRQCPMLNNGQFEEMGYQCVSVETVRSRGLGPCACARNREPGPAMTFHNPIPWEPLTRLVGNRAPEFMYMGTWNSNPPVNLYKHMDTRAYLNIDDSGQCYQFAQGDYCPIDTKDAIGRALL